MRRWILNFDGIEAISPLEKAAIGRHLMGAAVLRNVAYLRRHPRTPPLYRSGVRFAREPWAGSGTEEIAGIPVVLQRGWGDCDDLVSWLVAELQVRGIPASILVRWNAAGDRFHALVRLPNGAVEDPSKRLGM